MQKKNVEYKVNGYRNRWSIIDTFKEYANPAASARLSPSRRLRKDLVMPDTAFTKCIEESVLA